MSVGVMEDYKLRDLRASHTLGCSPVGTATFCFFLFAHLPLWESGYCSWVGRDLSKSTGRSSKKIVRQAVYSERPTRV